MATRLPGGAVLLPNPGCVSTLTSCRTLTSLGGSDTFVDDLGATVHWTLGTMVGSPAAGLDGRTTPPAPSSSSGLYTVSQDEQTSQTTVAPGTSDLSSHVAPQTYLPLRGEVTLTASQLSMVGTDNEAAATMLNRMLDVAEHAWCDIAAWQGGLPGASTDFTPRLKGGQGYVFNNGNPLPVGSNTAWAELQVTDTGATAFGALTALAVAEEYAAGTDYLGIPNGIGAQACIWASRDIVDVWQANNVVVRVPVTGGGRVQWYQLFTISGVKIITGPGADGNATGVAPGTARSPAVSWVRVAPEAVVLLSERQLIVRPADTMSRQTNAVVDRALQSVSVLFTDLSTKVAILANPKNRS